MTDSVVDQPEQSAPSLLDVLGQLIGLARANGASLASVICNRQFCVGTHPPQTDSALEPMDPQDMCALRTPKLGLLIAFPDDPTDGAGGMGLTTISLNERDWFSASNIEVGVESRVAKLARGKR